MIKSLNLLSILFIHKKKNDNIRSILLWKGKCYSEKLSVKHKEIYRKIGIEQVTAYVKRNETSYYSNQ